MPTVFDGIVDGTTGNDTLAGAGASDIVMAEGGNDQISGSGGADHIIAGSGDDSVAGGAGADKIYGGVGSDTLFGGADGDRILGDNQALIASIFDSDTITGSTFFDSPAAYAGWSSDSAAIEVAGGDGYDGGDAVELSEDSEGKNPTALNIYQDVTTTAGESYTLTFLYAPHENTKDKHTGFDVEIDDVVYESIAEEGSKGAEVYQAYSVTFTATGSSTRIEFLSTGDPTKDGKGALIDEVYLVSNQDADGLGAADLIDAEGGDDTVFGQGAGDTIYGGLGADQLYGGSGNDHLFGDSGASDPDEFTIGSDDMLSGSTGNDTLEGDDGNDTLRGGQDDDLVQGEDGNDTAAGDFGHDTVQGGIGDDLLFGDRQDGSSATETGLPLTPDVFHYRAQDIDGDGNELDNPGNGSSITLWSDASGNGADASNSGTAPVLDNSSVNSTPGVDFSGTTGRLTPPNSADLNLATFDQKSFAFAFQTGSGVSGTQMIYEQGGGTKGYNLLITADPDNGNQPTLYAMVWNTSGWASGHKYKVLNLGVVSADSTYRVVMVHDATSATASEQTWTGYVNGVQVDQLDTVAAITSHSGGAGLGDNNGASRLPDESNANSAGDISFDGSISEAISWNTALNGSQVDQVFEFMGQQIGVVPLPDGEGDDSLAGGAGSDTLHGQAGNDTLGGGADADKLYSGAGVDKLSGDGGNDTLYGEAGENSLYGDADNDLLIDTIGGGDEIHMFGGTGDDVLLGVVEVDNYFAQAGGAGNDTITLTQSSGSSIAEIFGDDTFSSYKEEVTDGNDKITASGDGKITVHGQRGDDTLIGGAGSQALYGGSGNDSLTGGDNDDTLQGYLGNDTLMGGAGNDVINGSLGVDIQYGGGGDDTLYWDSADTVIRGGTGTGDMLMAWAGDDTILMDGAMFGGGVEANGGFEAVNLGAGADLLFGDQVNGGDTSLNVIGGDGDDTVSLFGNGNDTINGGADRDLLYGGDGTDLLIGGSQQDKLYGGDGNDTLQGDGGRDTIFADDGNDSVDAGNGRDNIFGGAGNDTLAGGSGDDLYFFGRGDDTDFISDSSGDDTLVFFFGYNDTLYDEVLIGEVSVNYDTVGSIVTLTIDDGDDAGSATDGTISFAYGDIETVEVGAGGAIASYQWDTVSETFLGL
ncbi:calcium-binding protein [Rhodovibrionaceae bacterium A322]